MAVDICILLHYDCVMCVLRHTSGGCPRGLVFNAPPVPWSWSCTTVAPSWSCSFSELVVLCSESIFPSFLKITIIFVYLQTSILPALEKTSNGCMIVCLCFLGTLGWNSARAGETNSLERTFFSDFPLPCTSFLIQPLTRISSLNIVLNIYYF